MRIPDRALSKADVEKYWQQDRVHLSACFRDNDALYAYIETLQEQLKK